MKKKWRAAISSYGSKADCIENAFYQDFVVQTGDDLE
jgi:hypothetical protein